MGLMEGGFKIQPKDLEECRMFKKRCWEVPEWDKIWVMGQRRQFEHQGNSIFFYEKQISWKWHLMLKGAISGKIEHKIITEFCCLNWPIRRKK